MLVACTYFPYDNSMYSENKNLLISESMHEDGPAITTEKRRNPNLANEDGSTPLQLICIESDDGDDEADYSILEKFFEIIDDRHEPLLIDAQDKSGNTPLHLALNRGCKKMVQLLLIRGANSNLPNANGLTPLHITCRRYGDDDDLVKNFLELSIAEHRPVQVDAVDNELGRTSLHHALLTSGVIQT
ncbi:unnamed protein product [Trichogramma brassicae]|uniref:Uncharacterized protein n=1 Tax=Trichogramma brassicae TaxID=86971 RepID=A0A6H5ITS0_9HYME|nr:unnamed protein product [Trichogramma brassicae]